MKMTIVLDSDDREGINDALKMVRIMHQKYSGNATAHKESFGKIEFIKLLRKYMRESIEHMKNEESGQVKDIDDLPNLRNASVSLTASLRENDEKAPRVGDLVKMRTHDTGLVALCWRDAKAISTSLQNRCPMAGWLRLYGLGTREVVGGGEFILTFA